MVAIIGALARILLGSMLFAAWGISSSFIWKAIPSHFWRAAAMPFLVVVFLLLLAALMAGVSAGVRAISPKKDAA